LPAGIPSEAVPFLRDRGYLDPERLSAGAAAPDAPLYRLDGRPTTLLAHLAERPLVLIFGSYT
jgi:hypothetical protein